MQTAAPLPARRARFAPAVLALLALGGPAFAEKPKVTVTAARVGLPPGARPDREADGSAPHLAKFGAWAPVYLELRVEGEITKPVEAVIETLDTDSIGTSLTVPLPALLGAAPGVVLKGHELGPLPYIRLPDEKDAETVVRIRTAGGSEIADPFRVRGATPVAPLHYFVVSLGTRLPGFDLPSLNTGTRQDDSTPSGAFRNGRVQTAALPTVDHMPDQWVGYQAADLVVLTTGDGAVPKDFLPRLFGDQASGLDRAKRDALLEWVRRGGRLVVSVGNNAGLLAQMPEFQRAIPYELRRDAPSRSVASLDLSWKVPGRTAGGRMSAQRRDAAPKPDQVLPAANLDPKPGRPARVLMTAEKSAGAPVVVQAAFGLGKVTLVGFDLDRSPFTEYAEKRAFWEWVLWEAGAGRPALGADGGRAAGPGGFGASEAEDDLAVALRTHADTFDGVPVISFGWVAVFIVLYILLIGPVEYLILKKVLGRLELTWVTFPVIVLTVSAVAYFTAYAVKGRDLKVNKIDVVDVDVGGGRVYGQTWFTVFSPRIDTYTNTVVPADGWSPDGPEVTANDTLAGWVGPPRSGRSGSLLSRRYRYHVGDRGQVAAGLDDVPVQVWSTKSFAAQWSARLDPDPAKAAVESKLYHPPGAPEKVVGTFVNRMPVGQLRDAKLIYAGKVYPAGSNGIILPGEEVQVVFDNKGEVAVDAVKARAGLDRVSVTEGQQQWTRNGLEAGRQQVSMPGGEGGGVLLGMLFHDAALRFGDAGAAGKNASLRRFDQSWRLSPENTHEVILLANLAGGTGPADDALNGPNSPSRLWLKGLPGGTPARPPIPGTARQEAVVRAFLPVKAAGQ